MAVEPALRRIILIVDADGAVAPPGAARVQVTGLQPAATDGAAASFHDSRSYCTG